MEKSELFENVNKIIRYLIDSWNRAKKFKSNYSKNWEHYNAILWIAKNGYDVKMNDNEYFVTFEDGILLKFNRRFSERIFNESGKPKELLPVFVG